MRTNKILTGLLLYFAICHPQYVLGASFCTTSPEGKIRVDDCKYDSYDECKRVIGSSGDCVSDQGEKLVPAGVAPYCVVVWATECKYYNYASCSQAAKTQMGFCYSNPDYTNPAK